LTCPKAEKNSTKSSCAQQLADTNADPNDPDDVADELKRRSITKPGFSANHCMFA
jgi:hypothetical protein